MRSFVFNKHTYPNCEITSCAESAIYILHIFASNFQTERDSLLHYTANRLILLPMSFKKDKFYGKEQKFMRCFTALVKQQ